jgi:hypothetical protein
MKFTLKGRGHRSEAEFLAEKPSPAAETGRNPMGRLTDSAEFITD